MRFSVHEINQAASGGSYVCIFDADVELTLADEVLVSVEAVEPADTDAEQVESASAAIRAGAVHVLSPLRKGARIRVTRLVVNFVDFKPSRFTLYTAREINRLAQCEA
jgi:hypothetical protein